ncbi:MAG: V-type ATP synthase subunit F [Deltaproteobacteria bacterium]
MPEDMSLMNSLVIIGDEDTVLGFKALGFKGYVVADPGEIRKYLEQAVNEKTAVCLVQEGIYKAAREIIDDYKAIPLPVFIPFSKNAKTDLLDDLTRDIRLRATGAF